MCFVLKRWTVGILWAKDYDLGCYRGFKILILHDGSSSRGLISTVQTHSVSRRLSNRSGSDAVDWISHRHHDIPKRGKFHSERQIIRSVATGSLCARYFNNRKCHTHAAASIYSLTFTWTGVATLLLPRSYRVWNVLCFTAALWTTRPVIKY